MFVIHKIYTKKRTINWGIPFTLCVPWTSVLYTKTNKNKKKKMNTLTPWIKGQGHDLQILCGSFQWAFTIISIETKYKYKY